MNLPKRWSLAELERDAAEAREAFRAERMDEPLDQYIAFFNAFVPVFRTVLENVQNLARDESNAAATLADIVADQDAKTALRYLAAPPISEDDLKTLADTNLSAVAISKDQPAARRVRETLLHVIDPKRFPWLAQGRNAKAKELHAAIIASAALVAAQRVQTQRRSEAKNRQEAAVRDLLLEMGLTEAPARDITLLTDAPAPGTFSRESRLGTTKADVLVGLFDRRVLAVECKASKSAVNSYKRVNHEAAGKAAKWLTAFGDQQVIPAAVLSGVMKAHNLKTAQSQRLYLFWSHRLDDLRAFVDATRGSGRS